MSAGAPSLARRLLALLCEQASSTERWISVLCSIALILAFIIFCPRGDARFGEGCTTDTECMQQWHAKRVQP